MVWADLNPEDLFKRDVFDSYFAVMFIFAWFGFSYFVHNIAIF